MTLKQFRRMKVFAIRMVPVAIGGGRWKKELREHVKEILVRLNDGSFSCNWSHVADWDNNTPAENKNRHDGRYLLCDFMSEYCWDNGMVKVCKDETVDTRMSIALRCCIRAACDMAVSTSGGVLGFTVGDLKKMWGWKIPKWVTDGWDCDITKVADDEGVWL